MSILEHRTSIGATVYDIIAQPVRDTGLNLCVVDVGARNGMFMLPPVYARQASYIGFEPNPVEYEKLTRHQADAQVLYKNEGLDVGNFRDEKIFDCALWDDDCELPFHITNGPGACTMKGEVLPFTRNLYYRYQEGNPKRLINFYDLHAKVLEVMTVKCRRLDNILPDNLTIDFLKIDVEGAEMNVLRGSESLLDTGKVLMIRTEFQAFSYYNDHPVFGHQHSYLAEKGFRLIDIAMDHPRYRRGPLELPDAYDRGPLFAGDALFIRDPDTVDMSPLDRHRLALLCAAFGYNSLCYSLLADAGLLGREQMDTIAAAMRERPLRSLRGRILDAWVAFPHVVEGLLRSAVKFARGRA